MDSEPWWAGHATTLLAALFGVASALFGVWVSDRRDSRRLKIQLDHDAQERERERLQSLKREVYLPLADATSRLLSMLMRIATIPKEEWIAREPLKDFGRHMGRLALIAPREVVEPATKFQTKVAKVLIELGRMRQRLDTLDAEIEADERRIAELVPLVKVLGEQVRDLMETDRIMSREFDVTSRREGETSAEFSDLRKEVEELRKQRAALGLVLAQRAMDAVLETREYSLPATIAARRDIGLTSDDAWFAALQEAETKEIAEMASRSFNEEEQLIRRTQPAQ